MSGLEDITDYAWSMQDEGREELIALKYRDRKKLDEEAQKLWRAADSSQTVNGKSNPHYPRMKLEADVAEMRFEMSCVLAKNKDLQEQINILSGLYQRVSILEGAYNFLTMGYKQAEKMFKDALLKQVSVDKREKDLERANKDH